MFETKKFRRAAVVLGIMLLTITLFSLVFSKTVDQCYDDYERCRIRALQSSGGVIATTIQLTACDVGVAACIVAAML
ncbi:MAG: hypothetical protein NC827_09240 [Candidatus Omnitrophica bacterium]|nr:hypothetical protein [Candidatus Omnitrophota bacterium]